MLKKSKKKLELKKLKIKLKKVSHLGTKLIINKKWYRYIIYYVRKEGKKVYQMKI